MLDWLKWEVSFNDGTCLSQFNETDVEITFKKIQENINNINVFKLFGDGNSYSVNLSKGSISVNDTIISFFEDYENLDFRLIFFKRRLGAAYTQSVETDYFIGFQVKIQEKNIKKILRITKTHNYLVNET